MIDDDVMLSLDEAARRAFPTGGVTGDTLKRRIRKGELKAYKVGKAYQTTLRDVRAMIALCAVPAKSLPRAVEANAELAQALEAVRKQARRPSES